VQLNMPVGGIINRANGLFAQVVISTMQM
jgi:hypothetical protein